MNVVYATLSILHNKETRIRFGSLIIENLETCKGLSDFSKREKSDLSDVFYLLVSLNVLMLERLRKKICGSHIVINHISIKIATAH